MERDFKLFLFDIVDAASRIKKYLDGYSKERFFEDGLMQDAVIRRLQIIGEAVKNIPESVKQEFPKIEWKKAAAMRDVVVHNYFGVDLNVTWDTVSHDLPTFAEQLQDVLSKYPLEHD